jgi:hypothetical protein
MRELLPQFVQHFLRQNAAALTLLAADHALLFLLISTYLGACFVRAFWEEQSRER